MIQRTFVLIKSDGVQRALVGEITSRFEKAGLKIIGLKMMWVDDEFAKRNYPNIEKKHGKRVFNSLVEYLTEGPVVAICLEGVEAVDVVRKITGSTYPSEAQPGTIRGDYAHISKLYANTKGVKVGNLVHASANEKEAKAEIKLWFSEIELFEYKTVHEVHLR